MSAQVQTVRLYGQLGVKFGRVHRLAVGSAAEAIRALSVQLPGFDAYMTQSKDSGIGYAVFYGDKNLSVDDLQNPNGGGDIRFAPIIMGSKRAGIFNIIVGAVLIVVGAILTYTGVFAWAGVPLMNMGLAMMIGGVVQLLTQPPKGRSAEDRPENRPGYAFNGPVNTQAQGNPVPILYGELVIGSAVLSAGISAVDQVYIPTNPGEGSGGGGGGGGAYWHRVASTLLDHAQ